MNILSRKSPTLASMNPKGIHAAEHLVTLSPSGDRKSSEVRRCRAVGGFTLLEVVLAIMIAVSILITGLYLYQQAADLRAQLMIKTEQLSAIRLVMDRLTTELQTAPRAFGAEKPLAGSSNLLQFIKMDLPSKASWNSDPLGRIAFPEMDARLVRYSMVTTNGTNITGLDRTEETLFQKKAFAEKSVLVEPSLSVTTNKAPLTAEIRFAQFRYWDGQAWQDSWDKIELPRAVEVSLANEDAMVQIENEASSVEIFRRVIHLPAAAPVEAADLQSESGLLP